MDIRLGSRRPPQGVRAAPPLTARWLSTNAGLRERVKDEAVERLRASFLAASAASLATTHRGVKTLNLARISRRLTAVSITLSVGLALGYPLTKAWIESVGG